MAKLYQDLEKDLFASDIGTGLSALSNQQNLIKFKHDLFTYFVNKIPKVDKSLLLQYVNILTELGMKNSINPLLMLSLAAGEGGFKSLIPVLNNFLSGKGAKGSCEVGTFQLSMIAVLSVLQSTDDSIIKTQLKGINDANDFSIKILKILAKPEINSRVAIAYMKSLITTYHPTNMRDLLFLYHNPGQFKNLTQHISDLENYLEVIKFYNYYYSFESDIWEPGTTIKDDGNSVPNQSIPSEEIPKPEAIDKMIFIPLKFEDFVFHYVSKDTLNRLPSNVVSRNTLIIQSGSLREWLTTEGATLRIFLNIDNNSITFNGLTLDIITRNRDKIALCLLICSIKGFIFRNKLPTSVFCSKNASETKITMLAEDIDHTLSLDHTLSFDKGDLFFKKLIQSTNGDQLYYCPNAMQGRFSEDDITPYYLMGDLVSGDRNWSGVTIWDSTI